MYIYIYVDGQDEALAIVAEHLNRGHWVSLDGACELDDDDTAADIDQIVKRAAAPTEPKPFIDARVPAHIKRQQIINQVVCTTCKSEPGDACYTASGDRYGDAFVHAARERAFYGRSV
jgi:hypothetical protein